MGDKKEKMQDVQLTARAARSPFRNEDAALVCRLAWHEVCYYKIGYAARKESRVQQPARTVNRETRSPVAKMI